MAWIQTEHGYCNDKFLVGPPPNDIHLATFYLRQKESGVLRRTFHIGPELTLVEWLAFFLADRPVFGCWEMLAGGTCRLCGLGWINNHELLEHFHRAEVGFTFDPDLPVFPRVAMARKMIQHVQDTCRFDCLVGTIPVKNRNSMRFSRSLGFEICGPVKQYTLWESMPCDAWFAVLPLKE